MDRQAVKVALIVVAVAGCLLLAMIAATSLLIDSVSPREMTATSMVETMVRMHMYMVEHRDYPPSLSVLPRREGYANDIDDGWGRRLVYTAGDDGTFTLLSHGRDGRPGGAGDDRDMVTKYRTRNEDGSWNIDDEYWTATAEIQSPFGEPAAGEHDVQAGQ